MSSVRERRFLRRIEDWRSPDGFDWRAATPGFCIQMYEGGKKKIDLRCGDTHSYYDWASLTKTVFTVSLIARLVSEGRLSISDPIGKILTQIPSTKRLTLFHFLTHTTGLPEWKPYYKDLVPGFPIALPRDLKGQWYGMEKILFADLKLRALKRTAVRSAIYSDLNFLALGSVIVRVTQRSLEENYEELRQAIGLSETIFHSKKQRVRLTAPTEDCPWRKRVLRGELHDENGWALGGVAPHAGLFGPIDELSRYGLWLRGIARDESALKSTNLGIAVQPWMNQLRFFTSRAIAKNVGDWGLGFMMPTMGRASCGRYFTADSFGHLGFTGTSFWYDPRRDVLVSILSNRVFPTRANERFRLFRPALHEATEP